MSSSSVTVQPRSTARATRFDLVMLDAMLPGLDGITLCRALRSEGANVTTPSTVIGH
jgi:DNA-binding response OmpR family regulator